MKSDKKIDVEKVGDVVIVNFTDKIIKEEQDIQIIGQVLFDLVKMGEKKIIINLCKVEYLSSLMQGKLIVLNKRINIQGGKLVLCNIHKDIYDVFLIIGLNKLFNIVKDENAALLVFGE